MPERSRRVFRVAAPSARGAAKHVSRELGKRSRSSQNSSRDIVAAREDRPPSPTGSDPNLAAGQPFPAPRTGNRPMPSLKKDPPRSDLFQRGKRAPQVRSRAKTPPPVPAPRRVNVQVTAPQRAKTPPPVPAPRANPPPPQQPPVPAPRANPPPPRPPRPRSPSRRSAILALYPPRSTAGPSSCRPVPRLLTNDDPSATVSPIDASRPQVPPPPARFPRPSANVSPKSRLPPQRLFSDIDDENARQGQNDQTGLPQPPRKPALPPRPRPTLPPPSQQQQQQQLLQPPQNPPAGPATPGPVENMQRRVRDQETFHTKDYQPLLKYTALFHPYSRGWIPETMMWYSGYATLNLTNYHPITLQLLKKLGFMLSLDKAPKTPYVDRINTDAVALGNFRGHFVEFYKRFQQLPTSEFISFLLLAAIPAYNILFYYTDEVFDSDKHGLMSSFYVNRDTHVAVAKYLLHGGDYKPIFWKTEERNFLDPDYDHGGVRYCRISLYEFNRNLPPSSHNFTPLIDYETLANMSAILQYTNRDPVLALLMFYLPGVSVTTAFTPAVEFLMRKLGLEKKDVVLA
ncbi:ORF078 [Saltwater crocodilepox virus]|nr:ORF078 [Saltwater crocodilepox virus]QGT47806.1 ORF078 [Saltwater crocodilepox virus]QGT48446.1 ORF078 [Saltwater crocodilepox virus]QGT48660.1 ORF078 [Saltwater crocodilepox virus]QGT48872.1 ORF078 [Saltwater crocodilepox virus]